MMRLLVATTLLATSLTVAGAGAAVGITSTTAPSADVARSSPATERVIRVKRIKKAIRRAGRGEVLSVHCGGSRPLLAEVGARTTCDSFGRDFVIETRVRVVEVRPDGVRLKVRFLPQR